MIVESLRPATLDRLFNSRQHVVSTRTVRHCDIDGRSPGSTADSPDRSSSSRSRSQKQTWPADLLMVMSRILRGVARQSDMFVSIHVARASRVQHIACDSGNEADLCLTI